MVNVLDLTIIILKQKYKTKRLLQVLKSFKYIINHILTVYVTLNFIVGNTNLYVINFNL